MFPGVFPIKMFKKSQKFLMGMAINTSTFHLAFVNRQGSQKTSGPETAIGNRAFLAGVREELESKLFHRDLTLFSQTLDVVFIDTTSLYCYRNSETDWRKRGYSRDHRPDLPQFVLCVAVNAQGWPIAWEIFPWQYG